MSINKFVKFLIFQILIPNSESLEYNVDTMK